jgi:hypothetical protein
MEFNTQTSKLNASPEEREMLAELGATLDKLSDSEKKNIDSVLAFNLGSANNNSIMEEIRKSLSSNLCSYLGYQNSGLFLSILSRTYLLDQFLNKLKEESILSGKSNQYLIDLSSKYGIFLRAINRKIDRPLRWLRIGSNILIDDDDIFVQTKITRGDSESFIFNIPLENTILFADHFVQRALDVCNKIDKENVLEISEEQLDLFVKKVEELKKLHETVKNETNVTIDHEQSQNKQ